MQVQICVAGCPKLWSILLLATGEFAPCAPMSLGFNSRNRLYTQMVSQSMLVSQDFTWISGFLLNCWDVVLYVMLMLGPLWK